MYGGKYLKGTLYHTKNSFQSLIVSRSAVDTGIEPAERLTISVFKKTFYSVVFSFSLYASVLVQNDC